MGSSFIKKDRWAERAKKEEEKKEDKLEQEGNKFLNVTELEKMLRLPSSTCAKVDRRR